MQEEREKNTKLILLFGATGRTGFHIANILIDNGYAIRIVCRSKAKVTELWREKQISFEKIIEGKLNSSETISAAFESSQVYGRVSIVISALGIGVKSEDSIQQVQYLSQVRIIEKCKEEKIQKYIFITGALIQRPWNPISVILNTIIPNIYHWKAKAENYLRKSGLNYAIIRPTNLIGDEKDFEETLYQLGQGDKLGGKITRYTVAQIVFQTVKSQQIPPKLTFQCTGASHLNMKQNLNILQPDTEQSIVTANHRIPKYVYLATFLGLIGLGGNYFINRNNTN